VSDLPSTATLLIQGSDSRQRLDPHSGVNHYLCRPRPDPDILKLGSSTATTISQCGFDIADEMRNRMADTCRNRPPESVFREQARRICRELRDCLELNESTSIELTESGTDTHRRAVCSVLAGAKQEQLLVLMVEAAETGSGVPEALRAASSVVDGGRVRCHEIAIRDADGAPPLPVAAVDAAVTAQAEQTMQGGEHLLLIMVDQSKSGCVAPSLSCGLDLQKRYPGRIHLLLDGCQFRFSAQTLNRYLEHGVMVAITGSKFLAGPSFSGALLLPHREPVTMPAPDPGLLIRWQVALEALRKFSTLNDRKVCEYLEQCGQSIRQRLRQDPAFEPLATPIMNRWETDVTKWDDLPTIFPFRLRLHSARGEPETDASFNDAMTIYRMLQQGDAPRVQMGRPILAGRNCNGTPNGALRLCISAPMLTDAIAHQQQSAVIAQCMLALDRISTALEVWHEHFDS